MSTSQRPDQPGTVPPSMTVVVLDGRDTGALAYAVRHASTDPARVRVLRAGPDTTPGALVSATAVSDVMVVQAPEGVSRQSTDPVLVGLRRDTRCLLLEVDDDGEVLRASGPRGEALDEPLRRAAADGAEKVVVAGVDGSAASRPVVDWARDQAIRLGATLRLVAVHDKSTSPDAARRALDEAGTGTAGPETEVVIAAGEPVDVLVSQSYGAELLVVGRHGTSGLLHSALGGVGDSCARLASCPVVIVPPTSVGT